MDRISDDKDLAWEKMWIKFAYGGAIQLPNVWYFCKGLLPIQTCVEKTVTLVIGVFIIWELFLRLDHFKKSQATEYYFRHKHGLELMFQLWYIDGYVLLLL